MLCNVIPTVLFGDPRLANPLIIHFPSPLFSSLEGTPKLFSRSFRTFYLISYIVRIRMVAILTVVIIVYIGITVENGKCYNVVRGGIQRENVFFFKFFF